MRKGMMKGSGKRGYHNIIGKDPMVHSQSAKGIKQAQKIRRFAPVAPKDKCDTSWTCNSCGAINRGETQCSVCGYNTSEQWVCDYCGAVCDNIDDECPNCGFGEKGDSQ